MKALIEIVRANGGQVSYKRNPDGSDSPYELNITYVDAILAGEKSARAEKFLASQAIQYALPGVPATYIHSLLGSRNWIAGVQQTGRARTVNREKLQVEEVIKELNNPQSFRSQVFYPYINLIKTRRKQPAFHPNAAFEILKIDPRVFAIRRSSRDQTVFALTNISSAEVCLSLSQSGASGRMQDLISGEAIRSASFSLKPFQYAWLTPAPS
jgi:glycosidase